MKHVVFSFNVMVVSMRSRSLPILAPGKDLVFALLMLDLKHSGVRMKSIWWTCPLGVCQVAVQDNLWRWRVLSRVSWWLSVNSRILHPVSFVHCWIFLLPLPSVGMHHGLLWHCNHFELQVYSSLESLLWYYQAAHRTVWPPCGHGLRLVHRPEWLWCCVVLLKPGWSIVGHIANGRGWRKSLQRNGPYSWNSGRFYKADPNLKKIASLGWMALREVPLKHGENGRSNKSNDFEH